MREKEEKRKSVQVNIEVTKYRRDNVYKQNPLHSDGIRGDNSRYLHLYFQVVQCDLRIADRIADGQRRG